MEGLQYRHIVGGFSIVRVRCTMHKMQSNAAWTLHHAIVHRAHSVYLKCCTVHPSCRVARRCIVRLNDLCMHDASRKNTTHKKPQSY